MALNFTSWLEIPHPPNNHCDMKYAYLLILLLLISCEPSNRSLPTDSEEAMPTPVEEYEAFLGLFLKDWRQANELFFMDIEDIEYKLTETNASSQEFSSSFTFPLNWTEIQYREETEFSQEYDVTIKVKSEVVVTHAYKEGLWRFDSARQYDFNATIVKSYSDYSKTIGKAWIGRLPEELIFDEVSKLYRKVPPPRYN